MKFTKYQLIIYGIVDWLTSLESLFLFLINVIFKNLSWKLFKTVTFKYELLDEFDVKFKLNFLVTLIICNGLILSENLRFNNPNGLI